MEELKSYVEYVKDFIVDNLPEYEGKEVYACDLAYTITEGINADGSATYSRQKAVDYIKEWFDEAAEVYQYQVENYGQASQNPFENPKAWMVCMITEGVRRVLIKHEFLAEYWNNGVIFKEKLVEDIKAYVNTVDNIEF